MRNPRCLTAAAALLILTGCGGDDGGSATNQRSGQFLDAAVAGLNYQSDTRSGQTDANGEFQYLSGESVTFSIGELALPTVEAAPIVTALNVFNTNDTFNTSVVNLNRLLQSLDADGDPNNGIDLTALEASHTQGLNIDFASPNFDAQVINLVANSNSETTELVSASAAQSHFQQTLEANNLTDSGCTAEHPLVGSNAEFTTRFHEVVGTLTVVDDCTLEVSGFGYDGLGPNVFFYTGKDGVFQGPSARPIGPMLNGKVYVNDAFRLTLPEGLNWDEVNSLSVWCVEFRVSFGDAVLTPES